jgi:D-alanyl-D-alanine carboxypeptidase (penicillin-binding protein 5/6)
MRSWVTGVKTGHTFGARYVLVGSGRRKGVDLIAVAIGAPTDEDRFRDDLELLEYGFSQYRRHLPVRAGRALARPSIRYAGGELPLRAARTVAVGVRRGEGIDVAVRAPSEVEGPIRQGATLGTATVYVDDRQVASIGLRAGRSVSEASTFDVARTFAAENLFWFALGLSGILIAVTAIFRRRFR